MTVRLSPLAGAGWQFFTNNGVPLAGGKLYTYAAGTTTPATTYTSSSGLTANANPVVLDSAGRVEDEVWLTEGTSYKFALYTSDNVLIGTYDNVTGVNDIADQLTTVYSEFANTSNPAKGDALVGFRQSNSSGNLTGSVGRTLHSKMQEVVSAFDFMTSGQIADVQANTALIDVSGAVQAALNTGLSVRLPKGTYFVNTTTLTLPENAVIYGDGAETIILGSGANPVITFTGTSGTHVSGSILRDLTVKRKNGVYTNQRQLVEYTYADDSYIQNVIFDGDIATSTYPGSLIGYSVTRLTIEDCQFLNGAACQLTSEDALSTNLFSTGCVVRNCYMGPAAAQGFDFYYVDDLIVDGCIAHGRTSTYGCGFIIEYQGKNVTFTNCIAYDNTRSGFYLEPNIAYGLASITFNNCIAYNNGETGLYSQNTFGLVVNGGAYWGSASTFAGSNSGIALASTALQCTITGAYIHSNQNAGLLIETGNSISIVGNVFYNNNGPAIKILNPSVVVNVSGNTFKDNVSIVSGWVENQTGAFIDYKWATYTPVVYSNDGNTTVTISNSSVKYKKIGSVCHVEGYFEFSGSANNSTIYIEMPFTVDWTGSNTGPDAQTMRGAAKGSASAVLPVASIYYPTRLSISGMTVSDTSVKFSAAFEIA